MREKFYSGHTVQFQKPYCKRCHETETCTHQNDWDGRGLDGDGMENNFRNYGYLA